LKQKEAKKEKEKKACEERNISRGWFPATIKMPPRGF
jgi:hypothetical protein